MWSKHKTKGNVERCLLEVQVQDKLITCTVPVTEYRKRKKVHAIASRKRSFYKISGKNEHLGWRVINQHLFLDKPEKLIDSIILVTNGKRIAQGKIVRVDMISGDRVCPPASHGSLPLGGEFASRCGGGRVCPPAFNEVLPTDIRNASRCGGGTVCPPTSDGLPTNDE